MLSPRVPLVSILFFRWKRFLIPLGWKQLFMKNTSVSRMTPFHQRLSNEFCQRVAACWHLAAVWRPSQVMSVFRHPHSPKAKLFDCSRWWLFPDGGRHYKQESWAEDLIRVSEPWLKYDSVSIDQWLYLHVMLQGFIQLNYNVFKYQQELN